MVGFRYLLVTFVCVSLCRSEDSNNTENESARIYKGNQASIRQFPWMVGVHGKSDNGQWERWRCGGALISRNLVLTAEHCVDATPRQYRITLGSTLPGDSVDGDGKTFRYVDLFIKHGDGCILRMSESVPFVNGKIQPVRMPSSGDYVGGGVPVTFSGWGGTGNGLSDKLFYTTLNTITDQECKPYFGDLKDDVLCALNHQSAACGGDSGSPVVRYDNNVATHVGIINAIVAGPCGNPDYPALITRTNKHVDWINSEIKRHSS